ncbi:MAG: S8 family serine peptidase, partial [Oscillospiraceae bacterium]|nr:S8 family serine peptidase [Oscillospiraceae bacterium]
MLRNRKGKVVVSLSLSIITVLSLLVPMAQALQANTALETTIQGKWQAILDADLTVGDATEQADDLLSEETVTDISPGPDLKAELPEEEDLAGARYIVVYKTVAEKQNVLGKLAHSSKQDKVLKRLDNQKVDLLVYNRDVEKQQVVEDLQEDGVVVDYVQLDYEVFMSSWQDGGDGTEETPQDDDWTAFYGNLAEAHEEITGASVTVALLDGGIETTHSALTGAFYTNTAEIAGNGVDDDGNGYIDDVSGWDFVNKDNTVNDAAWAYEQGHSTHLAGILAGQGDVPGIAPAAGVLPLKVFQNGVAYTSDILEAISYAEAMGAQIANCSWGGGYYNRALYEAMENSEMLFVTAAGNSVQNLNTYPVYPACFDLPNVLTVSSVGSDEKHSYFSNYGNQVVDVAAPGYEIEGAWTQDRVVKTSGTSQAAAVVSGQAALVLSQGGNLSAEQVKEHIVSTADEVTGLGNKVRDGKRVNIAFSLSGQAVNANVIDVPDDTELPDFAPGMIPEPEEDGYEQYGAEDHVSIRANMETARHGLGVAAVDGLIYAIGGRGGDSDDLFFNTVEVYNPKTDMWTTKQGTMSVARAYFGTAVAGGKIYVFGGQTSSSGTATNTVEMYNPGTDTWTTRTSLGTALISPTATECNGNIYVIGGNNGNSVQIAIHRYNPTNNSWSSGYGALNQGKTDHVAFAFEGKIYIEGGRSSTAANTFINYTEEVFDISTGVSTPTGSASVSGMNAACVVDGARVFSAGGSLYKEHSFVDFIEQRMPPGLGKWKSGIMAQARGGLGGAVVDGVLYMIGGINRDKNSIFKTVEALEAGYASKAPLPK